MKEVMISLVLKTLFLRFSVFFYLRLKHLLFLAVYHLILSHHSHICTGLQPVLYCPKLYFIIKEVQLQCKVMQSCIELIREVSSGPDLKLNHQVLLYTC